MKKYMKYIKPYWIFFILSPLCMCIEVASDIQIPYYAGQIINLGVANGDTAEIMKLTATMLGYIFLAITSGVGAAYFATRASVNFACDVREDIFKKIQEFSFANVDKFSTGSLITRLTNDITQLQQLVVLCLRMLIRGPGMLIGAIIMAYTINKEIALLFLVLCPVLSLIIYLIVKFSYKKFILLQDKIDELNSRVREVLVNIRVIKAFTREDFEEEKFTQVNTDLKQSSLVAYRITLLQTPLLTIVVNFATIIVLWMGSKALGTDGLLIGDISALITYLTQVLGSVGMMAMIFLQGSKSIVSGKRISEILDTTVELADGSTDKTVTSGDIRFENVSFKYTENNEEMVLRNISIDIKSGETVGIIGSTGCGKTSFAHLIPRLYDANIGDVFVDGVNVKDYSLYNLREGVAVVLQNNILFSGSIKDNLMWGDAKAEMATIEQMSNWAAAEEFISHFNDGYDTKVEQGAVNLSGGQKQRLCIARALLKQPKILILDDSTSAVDTATERKINGHLHNDLKDTTKIIIAQRITSIINASKIIVMDKGIIEAIGTHDELLASCLTYQEIYNSQMGGLSNG